MSWIDSIREEFPKKILQVGLSALGFLIALAVNTELANRAERATYTSLLGSIRQEATVNDEIRTNSFDKYYRSGLVLREFTLASTSQCLANPAFVKYTSTDELQKLNDYMLNLSLANGYRRISESVYLTDRSDRELRDAITEQWARALNSSSHVIAQVKELKE